MMLINNEQPFCVWDSTQKEKSQKKVVPAACLNGFG